MTSTGDLVENYLDQLYAGLRGSPRQGRRILAEAEDHLREGVADGVAAGLTEREAQEQAISSFGSVRAVVRAHDRRLRTVPGLAVLADVAMSVWRLGSIGLLAVGASGLVAAVMNLAFGRTFVGSASGAAPPAAAACRHWLSNWPGAHSCAQAYLLESSSDAVSLRVFAGFAGLILLGGYYLARRSGWSRGVLPDAFAPTIGMSLFGAAGLGLLALSVSRASVLGLQAGPGFYLSGALVALALAAVFGGQVHASLLRHARS
jgi:hypothetical protein